MAFTENLDAFLADFGVSVTTGAVSGLGILDMPMEVIAGDQVISVDYKLTVKTSEFGGLIYGDGITVAGVNYTVRSAQPTDDGTFTDLYLMKLAPPATAPGGSPREFGLQDLADVSLTDPQQGDMLINDGSSFVNTPNVDGGGA